MVTIHVQIENNSTTVVERIVVTMVCENDAGGGYVFENDLAVNETKAWHVDLPGPCLHSTIAYFRKNEQQWLAHYRRPPNRLLVPFVIND